MAARFLLLLAVPCAEAGPFAPILHDVSGLLSTPVDLGLTGLVSLLLVRSVLASGRETGNGAASKVAWKAVAGAAAVAAASASAVLGLTSGRSAPSLLLGMGLFTGPPEEPLASAGLLAASTAFLGLAAFLAARAARAGPTALGLGAAGLALTGWSFIAVPSEANTALLVLGSVLLAMSLSERVSAFRTSDLLSRSVAVALLVGAAAFVTGAGASLGRVRGTDERLERAASRSSLDGNGSRKRGPLRGRARRERVPLALDSRRQPNADERSRARSLGSRTDRRLPRAGRSPSPFGTRMEESSLPSGRCGPGTRGGGRQSN